MNRPVEVVGIGTVLIDHVVLLSAHPEQDTKQPVLEDLLQVGGPVPTALVTLRRLGHRCRFLGSWGDDPYGRMIEADLQSEGIEIEGGRRSDEKTGFAHVWVCGQTASRTIAFRRSSRPVRPDELNADRFAGASVLHLDGWPEAAVLKGAKLAKEQGCRVVLDAGSPKPGMRELLRYVDIANVPRRSLFELVGTEEVQTGIERLLRLGPGLVTVTEGGKGAVVGTFRGTHRRPAFRVEAVDTSGAGDVFCGGLIHGSIEGWEPERMLEFAMACAALKCTKLGNRQSLPDLEAVLDLMSAH